jgi:hypothetical protein
MINMHNLIITDVHNPETCTVQVVHMHMTFGPETLVKVTPSRDARSILKLAFRLPWHSAHSSTIEGFVIQKESFLVYHK